MLKRDFFLKAMNLGASSYKSFLIACFSVPDKDKTLTSEDGPVKLSVSVKEAVCVIDDEPVIISDFSKKEPLFSFKEKVVLEKGDLKNVTGKTETTYGTALVNQIVLAGIIGDIIPFQTGNWHLDGIAKKVINQVATDDAVSPEQAHAVCNALHFLPGLTPLGVPAVTQKALTTDPAIKKRRNELLKEYKDRLDDPAVISKIEQELIAMDKEWLKGDPAEGFYKDSKYYDIVRKRSHIMHGGEKSFTDDGQITLIPRSLEEGWDLNYLPEMVNSLRDGSYSRGAATAIGGASVKTFQRIFQNVNILDKDCGSKEGMTLQVSKDNYKYYGNRYQIKGSKLVLLSESDLKGLIGKEIILRSPLYCKSPKTDFCSHCAGPGMAANKHSVNMLASSIGSTFMGKSMKAGHGKALKTTTYDPIEQLN